MEQTGTISTQKRKEIFIEEFKYSNNITQACKKANIGRTTFYRWNKQKNFKEKLNEAVENLKDQIENKLVEKALEGDNACLIFFCKTKMKERGYVEKQEIEHSGGTATFNLIEKSVEEIKDAKIRDKSKQSNNKSKTSANPESTG